MAKTYEFSCPVCEKTFRASEPGEPCCTGPSEMRDDHPFSVMKLVKIHETEVDPTYADKRSKSALILPHMESRIEKEIQILRV